MPIPAEDQPAGGSDGQLAVINLDTGKEWCLNHDDVLGDGSWLVGKNTQSYGGFIVDPSGHSKTYAEGDATAH